MEILPTALLSVFGIICVFFAYILFLLVRELSKPRPTDGTPKTLPNGMKIMHWQVSWRC